MAVTDAKNQTTIYQYDQIGRLIKEQPIRWVIPHLILTMWTSNTVSKTKADGRTITYIYDVLNRLVERNYPDNTSDVFQYDAAGNITAATNPNIAYYYSYDTNNYVTGVSSDHSIQHLQYRISVRYRL